VRVDSFQLRLFIGVVAAVEVEPKVEPPRLSVELAPQAHMRSYARAASFSSSNVPRFVCLPSILNSALPRSDLFTKLTLHPAFLDTCHRPASRSPTPLPGPKLWVMFEVLGVPALGVKLGAHSIDDAQEEIQVALLNPNKTLNP